MSKFFAAVNDLSSDSESSESSEEEQEQQKQVTKSRPKAKKQEDSESEEEERTIRSEMDKRLGAFNSIVKNIKNHTKISDFSSLMADFDAFVDEIPKVTKVADG